MSKYRISPVEIADAEALEGGGYVFCEWGTYIDGYDCDEQASMVVIDTESTTDPSYPEGFHESHLCDLHIQEAAHLLSFGFGVTVPGQQVGDDLRRRLGAAQLMGAPKPIPEADPDSAPFWAGCRDGKLLLQRCADCRAFRYPPASGCAD